MSVQPAVNIRVAFVQVSNTLSVIGDVLESIVEENLKKAGIASVDLANIQTLSGEPPEDAEDSPMCYVEIHISGGKPQVTDADTSQLIEESFTKLLGDGVGCKVTIHYSSATTDS